MSVSHRSLVVIFCASLAVAAGLLVIAKPQFGDALIVMATVLCGFGAIATVLQR